MVTNSRVALTSGNDLLKAHTQAVHNLDEIIAGIGNYVEAKTPKLIKFLTLFCNAEAKIWNVGTSKSDCQSMKIGHIFRCLIFFVVKAKFAVFERIFKNSGKSKKGLKAKFQNPDKVKSDYEKCLFTLLKTNYDIKYIKNIPMVDFLILLNSTMSMDNKKVK